MSLCRYFPAPSDRMAIIWTLMPVEDAVVLEYGPAGTTHFGGGFYGSFGIRLRQSLFTTHISEDDVIMGDVSRLEKAIVELDEAYHPKVIFVVASAVIAVIGTDIRGVCRYMQQEVRARLIAFEDGGFRGDYTYGLRAAYRLLAAELTSPSPEKETDGGAPERKPDKAGVKRPFYQILGASAASWRIRSDVWEIRELMREAFGWECGLVMGLECTVEALQNSGNASVNLVLRQEAVEAAKILQEKYGTPWVFGAPYGYLGTLRWLRHISQATGFPAAKTLLDRLDEKISDMAPMGGPMAGVRRLPPRAVIQGDYDLITGLSGALAEMGIETERKICSHSLKEIADPEPGIAFYPEEKERLEAYKTFHGQWILGDALMPQLCPGDNYFTCVSFQFVGKVQTASHLPFMGEKGMDYLRELSEEYFRKAGI